MQTRQRPASIETLQELAKLIRYYILIATTDAGSGHPTSSLSAVELMTTLFFGGFFRFDLDRPDHPNNDRFILSKGHASPLLYALYAAAGRVTEEEIKTFRRFGSRLEGHPTVNFPYAEAATGSLGQGLSIGLGMALNAKYIDRLPYKTYVLLGDGEMSEGSQWESIQIAAHYNLNNLVGIVDVNRLGQSGETMYGHDPAEYAKRISGFGWNTLLVDGHSLEEIRNAYRSIRVQHEPTMIIAKTIKGKGVSMVEDKEGWHGKSLKPEQLSTALGELGTVDTKLQGQIALPEDLRPDGPAPQKAETVKYTLGDQVATRQAYGKALTRLFPEFPEMVVLDAEVKNSTSAELFQKSHPERFFEMFIAEQNMVGAALGLSRRGKLPFVSTFACFLSRAYDQIRMTQYSNANIKFAGSHSGVSIGEDGPSQMGLADIALFRNLIDGSVLYPADAVATEKLVEQAARHHGNVYIRLTRKTTPVIYESDEEFPIGGSKVLRRSERDAVTVVAAGATLYEALAAYDRLKEEDVVIRVIDLYSVKPIDSRALAEAAADTRAIITVEDHHAEGGLGEAVAGELGNRVPVHILAVRRIPRSGSPDELFEYEEISRAAIAKKVREVAVE